jgi:hypothetical protein
MRYRLYTSLPLLLVVSLLLAACGPASTPTAKPTAVASPLSPTEPPPTLSASPTAMPSPLPPTEAPPTAAPSPATGGKGNADVLYVRAVQSADATWTFHVTVQHPDTGWEDYADGWDVLTPDGEVLKPDPDSAFTRLLLHPHVDEQPFTRSQSGITIPSGVTRLLVRAHDLVDGYGGRDVWVDLTLASGEDFEVDGSP